MSKEKPIIFSTDMVKAIIDGRKTQTRRLIQPKKKNAEGFKVGKRVHSNEVYSVWEIDENEHEICDLACPYGQSGDTLWVREPFSYLEPEHFFRGSRFVYKADIDWDSEEVRQDYIKAGYPYQWKPSIYMPREAARLFLKIKSIRVERLQDITEEDALAEGSFLDRCTCSQMSRKNDDTPIKKMFHQTWCCIHGYEFSSLWDSINGKKHPWNSNPWVWVIEFEKI